MPDKPSWRMFGIGWFTQPTKGSKDRTLFPWLQKVTFFVSGQRALFLLISLLCGHSFAECVFEAAFDAPALILPFLDVKPELQMLSS